MLKWKPVFNLLLLIIVMIFFHNCTVQTIELYQGKEYYKVGDYDQAVAYLEKAMKKNPHSVEARTMLYQAKLASYYFHVSKARQDREMNRRENAILEYKKALAMFADNVKLQEELEEYISPNPKKKSEFVSTIKPPVVLKIDINKKMDVNLKAGSPITKIFKLIGDSFSINFLFDKDFRDFVYSIEVANIGFYDILNQLCMIANARYRILDQASVLIYPDTPFKKRQFDLQGVKSFYLKYIRAEDAQKVVQSVFRDQQVMAQQDPNINALIIKGSMETLAACEKFLDSIDREKGEVEIGVEILEINRNLMNKIGTEFGSTITNLTPALSADDITNKNVNKFSDLGKSSIFITLPSAALKLLALDDNNKIIAKPNLRGVSGEEVRFMVGDEIPIPETQLQSISAGGVNTVPITHYSYKNVGVEIKITPYVHANEEVTIKLKMTINFVTGYIEQWPTLGKRELENIIKLKKGETNIIGGFIRDEVRGSLNGIPFLSEIPILGKIFGSTEQTIRQTDLIFSITPRVIRKINIDQNTEPIWDQQQSGMQVSIPQDEPEEESQEYDEEKLPVLNRPDNNRPEGSGRNMIIISPNFQRVAVNGSTVFYLRLNNTEEINSLTVGGGFNSGKVIIEDVNTDIMRNDKIKVFKNSSGQSFDVGFSASTGGIKNMMLAQIKVKFLEKGQYILELSSLNAYTINRNPITLISQPVKIDVY